MRDRVCCVQARVWLRARFDLRDAPLRVDRLDAAPASILHVAKEEEQRERLEAVGSDVYVGALALGDGVHLSNRMQEAYY